MIQGKKLICPECRKFNAIKWGMPVTLGSFEGAEKLAQGLARMMMGQKIWEDIVGKPEEESQYDSRDSLAARMNCAFPGHAVAEWFIEEFGEPTIAGDWMPNVFERVHRGGSAGRAKLCDDIKSGTHTPPEKL